MSNFDADFRLMKPPRCSILIMSSQYLIRVLRVKVRPDSPEKAMVQGYAPPKIVELQVTKDAISCILGGKVLRKMGCLRQ